MILWEKASSCSKLTISICMLGSSQYYYFYSILKFMQNTWKLLLLFTATLGSEGGCQSEGKYTVGVKMKLYRSNSIYHVIPYTALQINSNLQKAWELSTKEIKYTVQREPRQNLAPTESLPHGSPSRAFSQATLHYTPPIIKGLTSSHLSKACQTLRKTFNKEKLTFFFDNWKIEKKPECFNLLLSQSLKRINSKFKKLDNGSWTNKQTLRV